MPGEFLRVPHESLNFDAFIIRLLFHFGKPNSLSSFARVCLCAAFYSLFHLESGAVPDDLRSRRMFLPSG
jgi:hypothetical protein